jgi:hypothetical protein
MSYEEWYHRLPAQMWKCGDGREILFDKADVSILVRRPGEPAKPTPPCECIEWIEGNDSRVEKVESIVEEIFFDDLASANAVLIDWGLAPLPPKPTAEIIPFPQSITPTPYRPIKSISPRVNPWEYHFGSMPETEVEYEDPKPETETEAEPEVEEPREPPTYLSLDDAKKIWDALEHWKHPRKPGLYHIFCPFCSDLEGHGQLDVELYDATSEMVADGIDKYIDVCCADCGVHGLGFFSVKKSVDPDAPAVVTPIDLWGKLDPPTMPRGLLPRVIEQFAVTQGELMGVDPGGLAVAALTVCAAAIPDSIELQVKQNSSGWRESARLWSALIGLPSTKKSPIIREAARPLARLDAQYARDYREAKEQWEQLEAEERRRTPKPRRRQLKLEDTTIESAQEVLNDNPQGVLCLQDELGGWFGSMDKYNSVRGAAKDRGFWLQAWNGGSYSVNRVTRGCYLIENASVSVLGGIQPDVIRKQVEETHDDGLIQRLCPIVLQPGAAGTDEPMHEVVTAYERLIERLHNLKPSFSSGVPGPWHLPSHDHLELDDAGQAVRRRLEQKHQELMGLEVINKKLASHLGKYDAFFARLCVIWHCVEHATAPDGVPWIIDADTAERVAQFLHQFLLRHALAFYSGVLDLSDDHDRLAAVAGHILAHKLEHVTNRDVQRGDRTMRRLTRRETDSVFEQLSAFGWLFYVPPKRAGDPPSWNVNPEVHRLFADRAKQEAARREEFKKLLADTLREEGRLPKEGLNGRGPR